MASAGGKVILLGEHAVVYGVSAIAVGLDRGASAFAAASRHDTLCLGERVHLVGEGSAEALAFSALLDSLGAHGVRVQADLQIQSGMGLGASAALGVAIARAVIDHTQQSGQSSAPSPADCSAVVRDAAMAWERIFHGNPSGIDTAAATYGGCFRYSKSGGVKPLNVAVDLPLAIALTTQPASTKQMVQQVADYRARKPELFEKTLAGITSLVENAALCIECGDLYGLGKLLDLNHVLLSGLFLSTEEIELVCSVAREAGALGAKLTGSGGGGAVIALARPEERARVLQAWRDHGISGIAADVSATARQG